MMAIDTEGKLYCSLTQTNTDHRVFCLFITKLVDVLSKEDSNWRDNTILLHDGAKYATCNESTEHLKSLGVKFVISAPYSYSTSPIELAFAFLKAVHLNPKSLKTGKR